MPDDAWLVPNKGFAARRSPKGDPATLDAVEALLYVTLRLAADDGDQVTFATVAEDMNADCVGRDHTSPEWTVEDVLALSQQAQPLIALARRLGRSR